MFAALSTYLGSSYVNQFNKFGRVFQVYTQADPAFRVTERDIANMQVRNQNGDMIPIGTVADDHAGHRPVADQPLQSLSLLDHRRPAGAGLFVRPVAAR